MRSAVAALSFGLGIASIVACGTFSGAEDEKPASDGGGDATSDAASACPSVVEGPGACASDPSINLGNDPKNCGTCGHACGSTGSCVAGTCTAEKITSEVGFGLVLAGTTLFLAQPERVKRIDVAQSGGEVTTAAENLIGGKLRNLSASAETLYLGTDQNQYVLPIAGGTPTTNGRPADALLPTTGAWYAAPDDSAYYLYANEGKSQLARFSSGPLAQISESAPITAVTGRASTAYWVVDAATGSTLRGPFGAPKDLAKSKVSFGAITDDGEHAYYLDTDAHRLMRVDRDGIAVAVAVEPGAAPTAMTIDGERIVYATVRTEQVVNTFTYVVSVSRCGGPPIVLRKLEKDVTVAALAASGGIVYAATSAGVERLR